MRRLFMFFLLVVCWPSLAAVDEITLTNGMKVFVKEDHRAPVAVVMMWYDVGSADENSGNTGLSHALEHMMFKGTPTVPQGQFSRIIAGIGGQENAFTNMDYTAYFAQISADKLAKVLTLEADRMTNLILSEKEFAQEIKVIQEERRMRTDDNPQGLTYERFMAAAHLASPYHHPVIGWMSDLEQMSALDLKRWYEHYYAPNNAALVVVGDVDKNTVFDLAKENFSNIKATKSLKRKKQPEPPQLGKKQIEVHAHAKVPMIMMGFSVPSLKTAQSPQDVYALDIIAGILDAGNSARLAKNLQRKQEVAADIGVSYDPYARYDTQFTFYAVPAHAVAPEKLTQAIWAEIEALKDKPVPDAELKRIKTLLAANKVFEKDSIFGQAMEIGLLETVGLGWQTGEQWQRKIEKVSAQQIQQAAKRYFTPRRLTQTRLIPMTDKRGK